MKSYDEILNDLKNKIYYPVYMLTGEEPYYIDALSDYIENSVLDEAEKDFNQTILYGRDTDIQTILGHAKGFPMMANYKVVIVKEAQDLKKTLENMAPYFANPVPSTILVFCYKYETLDKRKSFSKTIDKTGVLFESKRIYDNQVQPWIVNYLKTLNYRISPAASYLLAESVGADLSKVVNELSKLVINLPQGTEILPDHIEQNIGISKDFNIFELTKALGKKDIYKANLIIRHFAKNEKENPLVKVVPTLYGFFSKLIQYHQLTDRSKNAVAAELGVNLFFVDDYASAAKNYPMSKLVRIIALMREYDMKSKGVDTGTTSDGDLMKELVYKILH